jgi:putative ABC transport system permease protein
MTPPNRIRRPQSRLRFVDLMGEVLAGLLARPGRTVLTTLGTVLGVGTFVAVLGLTATVTGQISQRFTALVATEIMVEDVSDPLVVDGGTAFPNDADVRVMAINGVHAAGVYWRVREEHVRGVAAAPPSAIEVSHSLPVVAASAGLLPATRPHLTSGRLFDSLQEARGERVAVLGTVAAQRLSIKRLSGPSTVFIGGVAFTVVGIIDSVERRPEVLVGVIVPRTTAETLWGPPDDPSLPPKMLVETDVGAASVVAPQLPYALRPDAPERFRVIPPPDPRSLREGVSRDLAALFVLLACVCLVIGAVGIANTTLVSVLERVPEIGLRRVLGGHRRHVALQFLTESGALGTIGGMIGAGMAVIVVLVAAIANDWTPLLSPWAVLPAPLLGTVTGVLAGVYPALRAARIEPVVALRR